MPAAEGKMTKANKHYVRRVIDLFSRGDTRALTHVMDMAKRSGGSQHAVLGDPVPALVSAVRWLEKNAPPEDL
jgi:hypothetical protein